MSDTADRRSDEFLAIADQFKLGVLTTESSHPVTQNLSRTAARDISEGLAVLFKADADVVRRYREFASSPLPSRLKADLVATIRNGGKVFFTGCGSTGRLSIQLVSIWRDFWQKQQARGVNSSPPPQELERRAFSVMAGGDYALIKSVEGFEDFTAFGGKQLAELGVCSRDIVFAITEGGETSFVIGTAWQGVDVGAKVYFVYNNPDDVLCEHVARSREVIQDSRIHKVNLTTGPMSITGSTRMQATSIQLCVMLTMLEMAVRELMTELEPDGPCALESALVPARFLTALEQMHATLESQTVRRQLAGLVQLEEAVYQSGHRNNYLAACFGIDVLTDTTERSPTYCTPPFRKFDDTSASESWSFLFVPSRTTPEAWEFLLKREPRCVEWSDAEVRELVGPDKALRTSELMRKISRQELMRFKVGLDGLECRPSRAGDSIVAIVAEAEASDVFSADHPFAEALSFARAAGARLGLVQFGGAVQKLEAFDQVVSIQVPDTDFLLDGITRVGVKLTLNALSTCAMVRLGRVMGNYMVWVVPSNLKLIDRATRYISRLAALDYPSSNRLLFDVLEFVEPRMKSDREYPPVVAMAVIRAKQQIGNAEAEKLLASTRPR